MAVFQELFLRGPSASRPALRRELIAQANAPWRHAEDREAALQRGASGRPEIIAFERDEAGGVDAVGLVLWEKGDGYEVITIVPRVVREIGYERYNRALEDLVLKVAEPAARAAGFLLETTSPIEGLDDWLSHDAADALRRFSSAANRATGSTHPLDRRRWFEFLLSAHRSRGTFDTDRLVRWLVEVQAWPEAKAHRIAEEYDFAMSLLKEYDQISGQ